MTLRANESTVVIPVNFGNGSGVNHVEYGKGKCVGFVRGEFWRIEFESGEVRDFLPAKLFAKLVK